MFFVRFVFVQQMYAQFLSQCVYFLCAMNVIGFSVCLYFLIFVCLQTLSQMLKILTILRDKVKCNVWKSMIRELGFKIILAFLTYLYLKGIVRNACTIQVWYELAEMEYGR